MSHAHLRASCAMALLLAASCAKSPVETGQNFAPREEVVGDSAEVVVTGSRVEAENRVAKSAPALARADGMFAPPLGPFLN